MPFTGFPPATTRFLAELSRNNNRSWFEQNRPRYERDVLEPAKAFVVSAGKVLADLVPDVVADPRVDGSIVRLDRDARSSREQPPFAEHLEIWFWEGERSTATSGFFLQLTASEVIIGAGARSLNRRQLAAYRERIADPRDGAYLVDAVRALARAGIEVEGEHFKRAPRGYELEGMRERLIRHNALYAAVAQPHPRSLRSGRFVEYCMTRWARMVPLHRWLVDMLG